MSLLSHSCLISTELVFPHRCFDICFSPGIKVTVFLPYNITDNTFSSMAFLPVKKCWPLCFDSPILASKNIKPVEWYSRFRQEIRLYSSKSYKRLKMHNKEGSNGPPGHLQECTSLASVRQPPTHRALIVVNKHVLLPVEKQKLGAIK